MQQACFGDRLNHDVIRAEWGDRNETQYVAQLKLRQTLAHTVPVALVDTCTLTTSLKLQNCHAL